MCVSVIWCLFSIYVDVDDKFHTSIRSWSTPTVNNEETDLSNSEAFTSELLKNIEDFCFFGTTCTTVWFWICLRFWSWNIVDASLMKREFQPDICRKRYNNIIKLNTNPTIVHTHVNIYRSFIFVGDCLWLLNSFNKWQRASSLKTGCYKLCYANSSSF